MLSNHQQKENSIFKTFLYHAGRDPNKVAVIYKEDRLTYAEFANNIFQLMNVLKQHYYDDLLDASKKTPPLIGVLCQSKLQALYCEFAILAVGAAFVPFSFNDSTERQDFMIKKSAISLILTDQDLPNSNASLRYFNMNDFLDAKKNPTNINKNYNENTNDLAYVLFTSGSTAQNPKGVMRSQAALLNQMTRDYKEDLQLTTNDCLLNLATFTHDQAIVDCFGALLNGCTLCLYDISYLDITNVEHLHQFMIKNQVTVFSSIPSMFMDIFSHASHKDRFPHLRIVTIGGEETLISHAKLYQTSCPDTCSLVNGYGATELSWISSFTITHQTDINAMKSIPLGYPAKSVKVKLVSFDDEEKDAATNSYELCVHSDGLALCYLNDEPATKEAFFVGEDGFKYYRTGDIVHLDDKNCIQFLGRKTWHEKINGKRLDLHAIENELKNIHDFKECAILTYGEGDNKKLYALHCSQITSAALKIVKESMQKILPKSVILKFYFIEKIPVLPNGKINRPVLRNILAELVLQDCDLPKITNMKQSDNINEMLEGYWREALEIPVSTALDPNDTMEDLGVDSKTITQLVNNILRCFFVKFGVTLNIKSDTFPKLTFPLFLQYVIKDYTEEVSPTKKVKSSMQELDVVVLQHNADFFDYVKVNCVINKKMDTVKAISFYLSDLKILIKHANQTNNFNIQVAENKNDIKKILTDFSQNSVPFSQQGLIFLSEDSNPNSHPITSVVCMDENNRMVWLIADGISGFKFIHNDSNTPESMLFEMLMSFDNLEIRFDLTGRQIDQQSCITDAILYETAALKCNLLKESIFLPVTLHSAHDNTENYYNIDTSFFLPYDLQPCKIFISPAKTFYHSQISNVPEALGYTPANELKQLMQDVKMHETKNMLTQKCLLSTHVQGKLWNKIIPINTTLWSQSYAFKKIIENYLLNKNNPHSIFQAENNTIQTATAIKTIDNPDPSFKNSKS